jgi:hypothetical protein
MSGMASGIQTQYSGGFGPLQGRLRIPFCIEFLIHAVFFGPVIRYHKLALPPVWIEHYPKEATDGYSETFELVVFSSYEVKERAPYLGETKLTVGEPTWKSLDRESVEALVGQAV